MGVLPLRIETGRYELCGFGGTKKGLPVEFRTLEYVAVVIYIKLKTRCISYWNALLLSTQEHT